MVFNNSHCIIFLLVTIIIYPSICYGQEANSLYSRATYYGSPDCYGTPSMCNFPLNNFIVFSVSTRDRYIYLYMRVVVANETV